MVRPYRSRPDFALDAVDDVGPLVGPADLQCAAMTARQFGEVVCLQQRVAEFQE
jgi:hypothetical protein